MQDFYNVVIVPIIGAALTAIVGYIGLKLKAIVEKLAEDRTKRNLAKICVKAVEQIEKELHGTEKYNECVKNLSAMLAEKGINVTELEIKMLIESAVQELNSGVKEGLTDG